jgi:hypothetical protein
VFVLGDFVVRTRVAQARFSTANRMSNVRAQTESGRWNRDDPKNGSVQLNGVL